MLIGFIALAALALAIMIYLFSGSAAVESWVGSQLLTLGGSYLQPELHFGKLTYRRPRTIFVDDLTLSSPDPTHAGQSIVILAVKHARLELTEIPRRGKPIKFSQVILDAPEFRAVAIAPGSGSLVGFSTFMKTTTPSTGPATSSAPPMLLSDFLLIRRVEITHGLIHYDPRLPNTHPMRLDDIDARLDLSPSAATPGLYAIQTTISRKPIFQLDVQGQFNIDTLTAQLDTLNLALDVRKGNAHFLPPEIQEVIKTIEMTGQLHIAASGTIPMSNFHQCALHSTADVTDAGFTVGPYRFLADSFASAVDVANGIATIQKADARLLGGEVHLSGTIPLDAGMPARLNLAAKNIQLEKTLRSTDPNSLPLYAGNVAADVSFAAPLRAWGTQASGGGTLSIRQGRLGNIPVFSRIVTDVGKAVSNNISGEAKSLTDTADATFSLAGDHVQIDHVIAKSGALGLRGSGSIGFDLQMNLRLNAGPMEGLQAAMGDVGKAWSAVSASMAGYRVTGTLGDPHVAFEVGNQSGKK
jgi:hypothetical protein